MLMVTPFEFTALSDKLTKINTGNVDQERNFSTNILLLYIYQYLKYIHHVCPMNFNVNQSAFAVLEHSLGRTADLLTNLQRWKVTQVHLLSNVLDANMVLFIPSHLSVRWSGFSQERPRPLEKAKTFNVQNGKFLANGHFVMSSYCKRWRSRRIKTLVEILMVTWPRCDEEMESD